MLRGQDVLILITGSESVGGQEALYALNPESIKYSKTTGFTNASGIVDKVEIRWTGGGVFTLYNVKEMKE